MQLEVTILIQCLFHSNFYFFLFYLILSLEGGWKRGPKLVKKQCNYYKNVATKRVLGTVRLSQQTTRKTLWEDAGPPRRGAFA